LLLPVKIRRILMKKILVLLLVLAVAGGVFAQEGTWSLGGGVRVGTEVNLNVKPVTVGAGNEAPVDSGDWNNRGQLNVGYKLGNLSTNIGFEVSQKGIGAEGRNNISLSADYDAGNYRAKASSNLAKILGITASANYKDVISELWGYYKLLNGLVHLEGAYAGRDNTWWESSTVYGDGWANLNGRGNSDGGLLANVTIESLQFGIMVPKLFKMGIVNLVDGDDSALKNSVFGFKFVMAPIEFAAQFRFKQYGVYFGGKYTAGPVVIGLNFKGIMDSGNIGVGASADYTADLFGAGVNFKYQLKTAKWMEVNPSFYYKVIPDYFYFKTELGFHFEDGAIIWKITPQIAWNFLGNGAKQYTDLATGIGARFNLVSDKDKASELWVGFKWGF
jgi:hypothetical protein